MSLTTLPEDLLTRVFLHLNDCCDLDCLLETSKATRAAAKPVVREITQKWRAVRQCAKFMAGPAMSTMFGAKSTFLAHDQKINFYCNIMHMCRIDGMTVVAMVESDRKKLKVIVTLCFEDLYSCLMHKERGRAEFHITAAPATGYATIVGCCKRIEFTSVEAGCSEVLAEWKALGLY